MRADIDTIGIATGVLVRRQFRGELERLKFLGHPISWHESKGWLVSEFTVRGPRDLLARLSRAIEEWKKASP